MNFLNVVVEDIGQKNGQRRVVLSAGNTSFGVFDGYKQGTDGVLRLATPERFAGRTFEVLLTGTMAIDVRNCDTSEAAISPNEEDPADWGGHRFCGTVTTVAESLEVVVETVCLYDDTDEAADGVELDPTPYATDRFAVVSGEYGDLLVDLTEVERDIRPGAELSFSSSRVDLLGYRAETV